MFIFSSNKIEAFLDIEKDFKTLIKKVVWFLSLLFLIIINYSCE
jgi:hypothetical protein